MSTGRGPHRIARPCSIDSGRRPGSRPPAAGPRRARPACEGTEPGAALRSGGGRVCDVRRCGWGGGRLTPRTGGATSRSRRPSSTATATSSPCSPRSLARGAYFRVRHGGRAAGLPARPGGRAPRAARGTGHRPWHLGKHGNQRAARSAAAGRPTGAQSVAEQPGAATPRRPSLLLRRGEVRHFGCRCRRRPAEKALARVPVPALRPRCAPAQFRFSQPLGECACASAPSGCQKNRRRRRRGGYWRAHRPEAAGQAGATCSSECRAELELRLCHMAAR